VILKARASKKSSRETAERTIVTGKEMKISVIICAYTQERWGELKQAIQSIQVQTVRPAEIILVIDHNPDLFELARNTFAGVKVVENQEERGLSGARNTGIATSSGQVIAFIDEDAIANDDWIENLLRGYEDPAVIGVGGVVMPVWADPPPDWFPQEFNWVVGCSYKGLPETVSPIRNPIGCNMSFRREAVISAGGFRNGVGRVGKVPVGCEETELTIRARQLIPNSIYLFQPEALVFHQVPAWRLNLGYFIQRCFAEGLSKAQVTHFVGSGDGLSSERRYVAQTLPKGVLSALGELVIHRKLAGLKRAAAIVGGLALTTAGYLAGVIKRMLSRRMPVTLKSGDRSMSHTIRYIR
jgi:glucosyl-dolichyl phosphate glucuronosyltransferase